MYWNGARLEGIYPASIVTEGIALNITLVTYDKQVDFGIMACRRSLPQVQRFIDYLEDSLVELEDAAGIRRAETAKPEKAVSGGAKAGARPRAKARPSVKVKTNAKTKAKTKTKTKARRLALAPIRAKAAPAAKAKGKGKARAVAQKRKANAIPRLKPKAGAKVVPKSRARARS
jgi:diacylglycerol O-acyltransferase